MHGPWAPPCSSSRPPLPAAPTVPPLPSTPTVSLPAACGAPRRGGEACTERGAEIGGTGTSTGHCGSAGVSSRAACRGRGAETHGCACASGGAGAAAAGQGGAPAGACRAADDDGCSNRGGSSCGHRWCRRGWRQRWRRGRQPIPARWCVTRGSSICNGGCCCCERQRCPTSSAGSSYGGAITAAGASGYLTSGDWRCCHAQHQPWRYTGNAACRAAAAAVPLSRCH